MTIPSTRWGSAAQDAFNDAAGLEVNQKILCRSCVLEGDLTVPSNVIYVDGTSCCVNHVV